MIEKALFLVPLLFLVSAASPLPSEPQGTTFSNAVAGSWFRGGSENELIFFNSTVGGALTHFWMTGEPICDDVLIRVFIDGEQQPSLEFTPAMAAGTGFDDDQAPWGTAWMGKGAATGGWYNNIPIPFSSSIRISFVVPKDAVLWLIARGSEGYVTKVRDIPLPPKARLQLLKYQGTVKPMDYVPLAHKDKGRGFILQTSLAVRSDNLNFLEGCYRVYTTKQMGYPGLLLSSGTEDFYSSAYYFNAGKYRAPESGLTHMNTTENTFSAYRFLDRDPVVFTDGMTLVWRNGDAWDPATGQKCTLESGGTVVGSPGNSDILAYTWVYVWDETEESNAHQVKGPADEVETIGTALSQGQVTAEEKTLFAMSDCRDRSCAMTHLWTTSSAEADTIRIRYYIDGESVPSIDMLSSMMAAVSPGGDNDAPWATRDMGHEANTGAWMNNFLIPFSKSIKITYSLGDASAASGCFYAIVRGLINAPYKIGALSLPPSARLVMQSQHETPLAPFELVDLANVAAGKSGMLFLTTMHVNSGDLNFLEGCLHSYPTQATQWPGTLLSTGTEDFFDSAYYFDAGKFHSPIAGLTQMDTQAGVQWGAYRFNSRDPVMFHDGFRLQWRNGDLTDSRGIKCFIPPTEKPLVGLTSSNLTSYVWLYTWSNSPMGSEAEGLAAYSAAELAARELVAGVKTFGTGLSNAPVTPVETDFYEYNVTAGSYGVLTHLWITGSNGQDDTILRFYVDGETEASVAFTPIDASGLMAPGAWNAGEKMGCGANTGGCWYNFPLPFSRSIRITYQAARPGQIYIIARGAENLPVEIGPQKMALNPMTSRLRSILTVADPKALDYVTLSSLPAGHKGFIYLSTLTVKSDNLNFLEGCFRLYPDAATTYPGILLSSGSEDFYDSAFYFDAGTFRFDVSGLPYMNTSAGAQLSMYRFQDQDPLFFSDGFSLVWRNGDANPTADQVAETGYNTKCMHPTGGFFIGSPSASYVNALTFVYTY